jgi:hypothetical protein
MVFGRVFGTPPTKDQGPAASIQFSSAWLDTVSLLVIGDMLLDNVAAARLRVMNVDAGEVPWRTFVESLDSQNPNR